MAKYVLSLPPSRWPEDLRARFERHPLTAAQRKRLGLPLAAGSRSRRTLASTCATSRGRPGSNGRATSRRRFATRSVRRWPSSPPMPPRRSTRASTSVSGGRMHLPGFKAPSRETSRDSRMIGVTQQLHCFMSTPPGLGDGILVQAWAPDTIIRRLQAAALQFDFCRKNGFPVDIAPVSLRAKLRIDQARVERGSRRIGGVSADLDALTGLAIAVMPGRSWRWLKSPAIVSRNLRTIMDREMRRAPSTRPSFVPRGSSFSTRPMPPMRRPATAGTS
jgi:hypothetical protein